MFGLSILIGATAVSVTIFRLSVVYPQVMTCLCFDLVEANLRNLTSPSQKMFLEAHMEDLREEDPDVFRIFEGKFVLPGSDLRVVVEPPELVSTRRFLPRTSRYLTFSI